MKDLEIELWDYIDGFCTDEERKRIDFLIENDENYHLKYQQLLLLQEDIELVDLDEPSMAFSFKVMEKVAAERMIVPLKTRVDQRLIYGIAGFFICVILLLLALFFANINWSQPAAIKLPKVAFSAFNVFANPALIKGFLFFDVILALFFADHYFRKWFFQQK